MSKSKIKCEMESRVAKAESLFKNGYNCAQAVFAAYADIFGVEEETALLISSSFGGGMGGMREVCGAVSGMMMVTGLYNGTYKPFDSGRKNINYNTVQLLTDEFRAENGSIFCKHLLELEPGLPEGYTKRPCAEYVKECAMLIEKYLLEDKE